MLVDQTLAMFNKELLLWSKRKITIVIMLLCAFFITAAIGKFGDGLTTLEHAAFISSLIVIGFVTNTIISTLVREREMSFRETFRFMGLNDFADILGKIFFNLFTSSLFLIPICTSVYFLKWKYPENTRFKAAFPNIWILSRFLFSSVAFYLANISFCFFVSNLIRTTNTCKDILGLLVLLLTICPIIGVGGNKYVNFVFKFVPHFAYAAEYESNFKTKDGSTFLYLIALFAEAIVYAVLYLFLDAHLVFVLMNRRKKTQRSETDLTEELNTSTTSQVTLNIEGIKKKFGKFYALRGVDLEIYSDRVTCILGHNGAGKTTLINTICGVLTPTEGSVEFKGWDVHRTGILKGNVGYCSGKDCLYEELTVNEYLNFVCRLKSIKDKTQAITRISQICQLDEFQTQKIGKLSGGTKRRVSLASACLGNPQLILLDEPSSGVDPENRRKIWEGIMEIKSPETIIILTTHHLEEAEFLSEDVLIVSKGQLEIRGTPEQIMNRFGVGYSIEISLQTKEELLELKNNLGTISDRIKVLDSKFDTTGEAMIQIEVGIKEKTGEVVNLLEEEQISFNLQSSTLEDAFIKLGETERELAEEKDWRTQAMNEVLKINHQSNVFSRFMALTYRRFGLLTSSFYQILVYIALILFPGFSIQALSKNFTTGGDNKPPFCLVLLTAQILCISFCFVCSFYAYVPASEKSLRMR